MKGKLGPDGNLQLLGPKVSIGGKTYTNLEKGGQEMADLLLREGYKEIVDIGSELGDIGITEYIDTRFTETSNFIMRERVVLKKPASVLEQEYKEELQEMIRTKWSQDEEIEILRDALDALTRGRSPAQAWMDYIKFIDTTKYQLRDKWFH